MCSRGAAALMTRFPQTVAHSAFPQDVQRLDSFRKRDKRVSAAITAPAGSHHCPGLGSTAAAWAFGRLIRLGGRAVTIRGGLDMRGI